jgi:hypothetical protein
MICRTGELFAIRRLIAARYDPRPVDAIVRIQAACCAEAVSWQAVVGVFLLGLALGSVRSQDTSFLV